MIKLLFLPFAGSSEPPLSEFIMKDLVEKENLTSRLYISSACLTKKGTPLSAAARRVLDAHGIPFTPKIPMPLEWSTYDLFDLILPMESAPTPELLNIIGGDVDGKLHPLPLYAGLPTGIANPYAGNSFEEAFRDSLAGCQGLLEKLKSWVK